jgi:hypothetical protein
MDPALGGGSMALALFLGMLGMAELGRRTRARRMRADPEGARTGTGVVEGAVFGLLGLILAFTFSGAAGRLEVRRQQIAEEANAIGTAWLRLDLLAPDDQPPLRDAFRRYLDARLAVFREIEVHDGERAIAGLQHAAELQGEIWRQSRTACERDPRPTPCILLLPAINAMIDITTSRTLAARTHAPGIVFGLLFAVSLLSAALAGYGMAGARSRQWLPTFLLAAAVAATTYVIYDLEYPRTGLIRLDAADRVLVELRASMH